MIQRDKQPENSDRMSLLVDQKTGLLTNSIEFLHKRRPSLMLKQNVDEWAKISDILKIHDFNYIQKVMEDIAKLQGTGNKVIGNFDN